MDTKPFNDLVEKWDTEALVLIDKMPATTGNLARADIYIKCAQALNLTLTNTLLSKLDEFEGRKDAT